MAGVLLGAVAGFLAANLVVLVVAAIEQPEDSDKYLGLFVIGSLIAVPLGALVAGVLFYRLSRRWTARPSSRPEG